MNLYPCNYNNCAHYHKGTRTFEPETSPNLWINDGSPCLYCVRFAPEMGDFFITKEEQEKNWKRYGCI